MSEPEAGFLYVVELGDLDAMRVAIERASRARALTKAPHFRARGLRWETGDAVMNLRHDELAAPLSASLDVLEELARVDALPNYLVVELLAAEHTPANQAAINALGERANDFDLTLTDQS